MKMTSHSFLVRNGCCFDGTLCELLRKPKRNSGHCWVELADKVDLIPHQDEGYYGAHMATTSWLFVTFDTAGEVIFSEASQSANQLGERVPNMGFGLFPTSPAVSLLVMMFDRSYGSEKVFQRHDRKMLQLHNCLEHKDILAAFTKSDEEPTSFTSVGSDADSPEPLHEPG